MSDPIRFSRGQLILAPLKGKDVLWFVKSVRLNGKATLFADHGDYTCEITTTVTVLPDDWRVVTQAEVLAALGSEA